MLQGTDYTKAGEIHHFQFNERLVAAITAGKKSSIRRKQDANEDALALIPMDGAMLVLVADSHYGAVAANVAISRFADQLAQTKGTWKQRLFQTMFLIDNAIQEEKDRVGGRPGCATTLIAAVIEQERLHYAAYGDSRCWLMRNDQLQDLIPVQQGLFLGEDNSPLNRIYDLLQRAQFTDSLSEPAHKSLTCFALLELYNQSQRRPLTDEEVAKVLTGLHGLTGLQTQIPAGEFKNSWLDLYIGLERVAPRYGAKNLEPGDRLFFATDGIEENQSALSLEKLGDLLRTKDPAAKVAQKIMKACMGWRGGGDNLSIVLIDC
nr:protein phosphatase 2C domain-containing protein [Acanthopleuribacter pedis]